MIKYRARHRQDITKLECARETKTSVWVHSYPGDRPSRHSKRSEYQCFFDTWEEARCHLLDVAQSKALSLRRQLELTNSLVENLKGMKNPEAK